ncbi:B3 domain-containing protein [Quillaja saponaria]|uniref:B3 domain-containing protein n=1 Tax=Quillaja saponaria TaxID=32244 RepID=A0AAD7L2Z2_QUISA|nr:B3 domain-containing protein [Quillaja saponaria]
MGSSGLDLLADVAAQKLEEEGRAETERKDKQGLKFISLEEKSLIPNSLSLSQFRSHSSESEKKYYLDTETRPVTHDLSKRSEIGGRSVSGFEEFHFRGLNKSRKRCFPFPSQEKSKEGEITVTSPIKKKQRRVIDHESQPELPVEFRTKIEELGGSEIKLVIQKELFGTDLNRNNGRFSIPQTQILAGFLTESEMAFLDQRQRNNQGRLCGLDVLVLDPSLVEFNLHLKKRKMEKTDVYNLTHK